MPERQAVVTLYTLYTPDTFSFRSLTFASDDDYVDIGRSSKRETKNLIPAQNNAWFDSRVMSRDHARIGVNMAEKTVIIRDGGSMHGTWVNDRRIPVDQDVVVNSGDILTFGADVTRGAETFPPLRVRCGCEWFDSSDAAKENISARKRTHPINTFIVPDDDDDSDVVEVVEDSVPARPMSPQDHEFEVSDQSGDTENQDVRENSTPITSPSTKEVSLGFESKPTDTPPKEGHSDPSDGTSGSPIVLDGDEAPVTPRMTPPPASNNSNFNFNNVDSDADAMDHDSDHSSSVASSPRETQPATEFDYWDEEDVISYGFGSESESSNDESSDSEMDSESENATSHCDDLENKPQSQTDNKTQVANEKEVEFSGSASTIQPQTIQPQSTEEAQNNFDKAWSTNSFARSGPLSPALLCDPYAIPRSSLQQTGNSYVPRLPSLHALSSSGWEPQAVPRSDHFDIGTAPRAFGHRCTRFDDLPVRRQPRQTVLSAPAIPPVIPSSYNGSSGMSPVKNDIYNAQDQWQVEKPGLPGQSKMQRTTPMDYSRGPNTRLCISDIVDSRSQEARSAQGLPPKRKADEMESVAIPHAPAYPYEFAGPSPANPYASGANTVPLGTSQCVDDESFSQDAQPRPSLPDLEDSTQNTSIHSIPEDEPEEPKSVPEVERPSKRIKTSDEGRGRFVTHAATALAGAVLGGLGTVALLASLPPDYFV
ncbi:hypothetical protein SI65_07980 [Aspergillus cristatus]|uniref:FHA domain-containing protein n=1 Tax=Aspergillus cristatus TaxID=573508 RepID=A0A1E3B691_ASPCR|nr:hypothetical protein SI65_07980 [Aspergillus cristatus]